MMDTLATLAASGGIDVPMLTQSAPDLAVYDELLTQAAA